VGYQKTNVWYGKVYGAKERTIKSWRRVGVDCGEMPPLDDPALMIRWWQDHRKHRVPKGLVDAAAKAWPVVIEKPVEEKVEPDPEMVDPVDLSDVQGVSDMGLEQMRQVVAMRAANVAAAYKAGNELKINAAQKRFEDSSKTLRMLEKSAVELSKMGGDLVSKKEMESELAPMLRQLAESFLTAMMEVTRLANPQLTRDAIRRMCVVERDKCFRSVRGYYQEAAA